MGVYIYMYRIKERLFYKVDYKQKLLHLHSLQLKAPYQILYQCSTTGNYNIMYISTNTVINSYIYTGLFLAINDH